MQISPLAIAVDGVLIMAIVNMIGRISAQVESVTPLSASNTRAISAEVEDLAPVVPWYVERLVMPQTALRITFSSRGVLPETVAFLASIANAQLQFRAVQHTDVLVPLDQLVQMVQSLSWSGR